MDVFQVITGFSLVCNILLLVVLVCSLGCNVILVYHLKYNNSKNKIGVNIMDENNVDDVKQKLKKMLDIRKHHRSEWDKIPAITSDLAYTYLNWCYNDNEIKVKSKDYNLIALVKQVIDIYLEEGKD